MDRVPSRSSRQKPSPREVSPDQAPAPAAAAPEEAAVRVHCTEGGMKRPIAPTIVPYDFRCPSFLAPNELRRVRVEHETFTLGLAARLSIHLRADFGLRMIGLESRTYQQVIDSLPDSGHISLFKADPLRGIWILALTTRLARAMVDRLMGGPGSAADSQHGLSDIDLALLEEVDRIVANEWCTHWSKAQELQPVLLGHETSGRFLQTSQPDAAVFELSLEARFGDLVERITLGFPFATVEPLIRALGRTARSVASATPVPRPKWSCDFDDVPVSMVAEYAGIKLTARELTHLKLGDVIPLPPDFSTLVRILVANRARFAGRLGACARKAAVEVTRVLPA